MIRSNGEKPISASGEKMIEIANSYAKAVISEIGAELKSFVINSQEFIYQPTEGWWQGSSPVLFPTVGPMPDNKLEFNNKIYGIDFHGFAKSSVFSVENKTADSATFKLSSNDNTLKSYPFDFAFLIQYTLIKDGLEILFSIKNNDTKNMYFGLGLHTGYKLFGDINESKIIFDSQEDRREYSVDSNDAQLNVSPLINKNILYLSDKLFEKGAVTFSNLKSKKCVFENQETNLEIDFSDFSCVTLWKQPSAPFLCIEPWSYKSGHYIFERDIEKISGMTCLLPECKKDFRLEIKKCKGEKV